jgi:hypothetical protein
VPTIGEEVGSRAIRLCVEPKGFEQYRERLGDPLVVIDYANSWCLGWAMRHRIRDADLSVTDNRIRNWDREH